MTYRFVQGIDYGPRDGTLGISFHMSEGGDGLADGFLARKPGEDLHEWANRVNGVSCHAAILSTGEIVQMLDWRHASGNLNPDDRAGEYGYYGGHHLRDVLGPHWPDPNTWTVSAELAGFRAQGPTDKQVTAAIKWGHEMRAMFPTIRGATGHHDQSPKPCPGLSDNMKAIFAGVGGHGLWPTTPEEDMPRFVNANGYAVQSNKRLNVVAGDKWQYLDGAVGGSFPGPGSLIVVGTLDSEPGRYVCLFDTETPYPNDAIDRDTLVLVSTARALEGYVAPALNCDAAVNKALDHVAGAVPALTTAIAEARPR